MGSTSTENVFVCGDVKSVTMVWSNISKFCLQNFLHRSDFEYYLTSTSTKYKQGIYTTYGIGCSNTAKGGKDTLTGSLLSHHRSLGTKSSHILLAP